MKFLLNVASQVPPNSIPVFWVFRLYGVSEKGDFVGQEFGPIALLLRLSLHTTPGSCLLTPGQRRVQAEGD